MALCGIVQADDMSAYVIKDSDYSYCPDSEIGKVGMVTLDDIVDIFNTGTFAISFDVSNVLDADNSFEFQLSYGANGKSGKLAFSYAPNPLPGYFVGEYLLTVPGGDLFSAIGLNEAIDSNRLIFQINDFFGDAPTVSLFGYTEGEDLKEFWSVAIPGSQPTSFENASLRVCGNADTYTPLDGIDLTIWQGTVSASDMANPTPAPSVPEPTTATLSLLALAGLAARRRRK